MRSASSAAMPESPPEQVRIARPPVAARPGPRLGQDARELEQLVRVARPRGARLLDQRPEDALVAGERAGVCGRGRRGPCLGRAGLEHRDADPALGAAGERLGELLAVPVRFEEHRDRADAVALAEREQPVGRIADRAVARSRSPCGS